VALACDIRIASENAVVGLPEVSLGLIPAAGGTQRLTRLIGVGQAKYLIMTAKRLKAEDALNRGILSKVVPHDQLDNAILEILNELFNLGPVAIGAAKYSIQASLNENITAGLEIELDEAVKCFMTKDLREGMTAFLEKRKANFIGK
jgi:enoyl-CoA hydratase